MAQRQLDASFWDDPDVASLSVHERLLLICMITDTALTNDYGVLPANPAILKKHAFGYDPIGIEDVSAMLDHILAVCRNVVRFMDHDQEWLHLRNFLAYQGIRYKRKTTYPNPPQESAPLPENCGNFAENSGNVPENSCSSRDEMSRGEVSSADAATAALFQAVHDAGIIISPTMAQEYADVLDNVAHGNIGLVLEAFQEAGKQGARASPAYISSIVDRCIREHCRPGEWPNGKRKPAPVEIMGATKETWG